MDNNTGFLVCCRIVSQVTTTIDGRKFIGRGYIPLITFLYFIARSCPCNITFHRLKDIHRHITLRRTVQVVTAKHSTTLHHFDRIISFILITRLLVADIEFCCWSTFGRRSLYRTQIHGDITINRSLNITGCNGTISIIKSCLLSQSATVGITFNQTTIQVDSSGVGRRSFAFSPSVIIPVTFIRVSQRTSTIDILFHCTAVHIDLHAA